MDAESIRHLLTTARRMDLEFQGRGRPADPACAPWMPSDTAQFLVLLIEAISVAPGNRFFEAGCGPGTKMMLAQRLFGLETAGIEYDAEMAMRAAELGANVELGDVRDFKDWDEYDIVFFNRPLTDRAQQRMLEKTVWDGMAPGAVVIAMNLEDKPPSWGVVADDWEARRGVWRKPEWR